MAYAALSYTWGPKTRLHNIEIDGKIFQIRDSLYQFLCRLSLNKLPCEYLWTDAICINQDDVAEKTVQVRIMGTIFSRAYEVLAWLGEEDESSALVMNLAASGSNDKSRKSSEIRSRTAANELQAWEALRSFYDRPYWRRTWVIQEIKLAKGTVWVYCGLDVVPYIRLHTQHQYMLCEANERMRYDPSFEKCRCRKDPCEHQTFKRAVEAYADIGTPVPAGLNDKEPDTLIELMDRYVDTLCEDPRDKIFALLALQNDIPTTSHFFDYSLDVHYLFCFLLTLYSNARKHIPRSETQWMIDGQYEALTSLVECGQMLIRSLKLTTDSLHRYLDHRFMIQSPMTGKERSLPRVEVEHLTWPRPIISVELFDGFDTKDYLLFDTEAHYISPEDHVRGLTLNTAEGDMLYKFQGSDVALVIKHSEKGFTPVSWAIMGMGQRWLPKESDARRLDCLKQRRLPEAADWTCRRWDEGERPDLQLPSEYTPEAFEERAIALSWNRIWLAVDIRVAISIVEGYVRRKSSYRRENYRLPSMSWGDRLRIHGPRNLFTYMRRYIQDEYTGLYREIALTWLWNF